MNEQDVGERKRHVLLLAYQSLGIVYGDLSISPLYVYESALSLSLRHHLSEEVVLGALSVIFWSLTLFPLVKYVGILLYANDNDEGGTLALYSLLLRHAKISLLPNHQAVDEELHKYHRPGYTSRYSPFGRYLEKHQKSRNFLLFVVLLGASMVIGDGVFTPALSVLSSFQGFRARDTHVHHGIVVPIVCIVLVALFALQHCGTDKVAFIFAPVVMVWLLAIAAVGIYNIIKWNPRVFQALSPHYIYKFFKATREDGWLAIGGLLLCITGTEAMFVDLGHFSVASVKSLIHISGVRTGCCIVAALLYTVVLVAFSCLVYPCLVLQYMGQAAFLSKNHTALSASFYCSIPDPLFWPIFVLAILAAIVGSQAVISATFSIVKQCQAIGCFPHVKIVHTSTWIPGRVYIPEINWMLMILSVAVTIGFHEITLMGNAYGLACMIVTFVNTWLFSLVVLFVWHRHIVIALLPLLFFTPIESVYLSSSFVKVSRGGWAPLALAFIILFVMFVWHYGSRLKYNLEVENKVPMKWILALGPSLGIARVPGIGLIYTSLVSGVPAIFTHFLMNLPAIHQVVVFVCIKSVPIPHVSLKERYLVGRIGPRSYRMYRCIIRYGYKDTHKFTEDFEDNLVMNIAEFIRMEADDDDYGSGGPDGPLEGRLAMVRSSGRFGTSLVPSESTCSRMSTSVWQSSQSKYEKEATPKLGRRRSTRYELPVGEILDEEVEEELTELVEAKEAGVAYIVGHSYIRATRDSFWLKRFVINVAYAFLRSNCRAPAVVLHIPHISLIEVGMLYYL